jgi:hypothetical protein
VSKIFAVVIFGIALAFLLRKAFANIPLVVWVAILTVVPTLGGLEMSIRPPATPKAKFFWRAAFGIWGVAICLLVYLQFWQTRPIIPRLPDIVVETVSGLPEGMQSNPHLRLHRLAIRNANDIPIENFCSRLQLPEPVYATFETNLPPGTSIGWRPLTTKVTINGSGSRSTLGPASSVNYLHSQPCFFPAGNRAQLSSYNDGNEMTGVWELTIDKLPPHGVASIMFLTSSSVEATGYLSFVKTAFTNDGATLSASTEGTTNGGFIMHNLTVALIVHTNKVINPKEDWHLGTNELRFSVEGIYQFAAEGKPGTRHFLVPLAFNEEQHTLASLAIQPDDGKWKRVMMEYQ